MNDKPFKLDLGCGVGLQEGFTGVDMLPLEEMWKDRGYIPEAYENNYVEHDLFEFPWPFEDNSVDEVYSGHLVEHIPHQVPGQNPKVDGWWLFFGELHRVMKKDGLVTIRHPFSRSDRAFWDPTHTRYIHYQTWFYLQKQNRLDMGVDHYAPNIDFEVMTIDAMGNPAAFEGRNNTWIDFARVFYFNPTEDLLVYLKAIKS